MGTTKSKRYEDLEFTDDFLFCKILQNDPDLCKELTELILGRKIGKIITLANQRAVEITPDAKGVRFDVYLEDDEFTVYDIEMQTYKEENLPKRARYYQGMIDLNMIERGAKYSELKSSYVVFICLKNPFPEMGLHKYEVKSMCVQDPSFDFGDEAYKIILSAEGDKDDVSEDMRNFLRYLTTREADSELTKKLDARVKEARRQTKWRIEYMTLEEHYEKKREEGREEGLKEGREEGLKEGREAGIKAGEDLLGRLISRLLEEGLTEEAANAAKDQEYRESLYKKYGYDRF